MADISAVEAAAWVLIGAATLELQKAGPGGRRLNRLAANQGLAIPLPKGRLERAGTPKLCHRVVAWQGQGPGGVRYVPEPWSRRKVIRKDGFGHSIFVQVILGLSSWPPNRLHLPRQNL
jgi:hypothetical protein